MAKQDIVVIKKYANRRLYNTQTSTYITLDDLYQLVKEGQDFEVVDAKTGKDMTHATLIQIIFEGEANKESLMPVGFLRQLIRFYDDSLHSVVPQYLESSMDVFTQNQEKFRQQTESAMQGWESLKKMTGLQDIEEAQRRNIDLMRQTFRAFNPLYAALAPEVDDQSNIKEEISLLRNEIERLRLENAQLKGMARPVSVKVK